MEHKNLKFSVKSADGTGHFSGLANGTEIVDMANDVIHEGAFKKTIKDHNSRVPVLKGHDSSREIGMTLKLEENRRGLVISDARLYVDDVNPKNEIPDAREELIRMRNRQELGKPMGISIGFTIPEGGYEYDNAGIRHINEVRLWEVSTTAFPANQASWVEGVKSVRDLPRVIAGVASECTGPLCSTNRRAVASSIDRLQSLLDGRAGKVDMMSDEEVEALMQRADDRLTLSDADEIARKHGFKPPQRTLTDTEFRSMMKRMGIKVN